MVLIRQMPEGSGLKDLNKIASAIEETLRSGSDPTVVVGIGTVATHLRDLAKSYKEAQIAIEVGKVFDTEKYVINYENLGIGRLIYQLPTTLCEMFLQEVFKRIPSTPWIRRPCLPSISSLRTTSTSPRLPGSCSSTAIRWCTGWRRSRS